MTGANKRCVFPDHATGRACGTTATHEVTLEGAGGPQPACPTHTREAAVDPTRRVAVRRLRLH